jgi:hypothetical protein
MDNIAHTESALISYFFAVVIRHIYCSDLFYTVHLTETGWMVRGSISSWLKIYFFFSKPPSPSCAVGTGCSFPAAKEPGREADQTPPSSVADKRMSGETPLLPLYSVHTCNFTSDFTFVFRSSPRCCLHLAERWVTRTEQLPSMWQ